ncbi:hypothetical protein CLAFUW4_14590 [Fulvia fulva]|uniref:Uncharacterized protein n=1 Tax=Passalora fulva TaxID=5499 RepID=A0A9Q8PLY8_PASFU|nr:uncharacterized protein CLAFUR5_14420 [Fulvia fulva]KAK4609136.1 hypothetical protein CLAFUR4_14584 [Fulvia fulva]KAK4609514.1 hypothetical protein CLAFUR0_14584 [Fulvia fulva]UJO24966.1 hypothetical protein CLAFUR5_14420 [Fulvia fulva]WPV22853.1 hypothetical protein CLAFUW4_14590 [Fulvia fulva]WPV37490.1 hypothetical protein CLAFUW7_14593 [Fulvia fulva]
MKLHHHSQPPAQLISTTPMSATPKTTAFAKRWLPRLAHPLANWPGHWFEEADKPLALSTLSTDHVYIKQLLDVLHLFDDDVKRHSISSTDFANREHVRLDPGFEKPWLSDYTNPFAAAAPLRELVTTSVWWFHMWRVMEVTHTKRGKKWDEDAWEKIYTQYVVAKEKGGWQSRLERGLYRKTRQALLDDMPLYVDAFVEVVDD